MRFPPGPLILQIASLRVILSPAYSAIKLFFGKRTAAKQPKSWSEDLWTDKPRANFSRQPGTERRVLRRTVCNRGLRPASASCEPPAGIIVLGPSTQAGRSVLCRAADSSSCDISLSIRLLLRESEMSGPRPLLGRTRWLKIKETGTVSTVDERARLWCLRPRSRNCHVAS